MKLAIGILVVFLLENFHQSEQAKQSDHLNEKLEKFIQQVDGADGKDLDLELYKEVDNKAAVHNRNDSNIIYLKPRSSKPRVIVKPAKKRTPKQNPTKVLTRRNYEAPLEERLLSNHEFTEDEELELLKEEIIFDIDASESILPNQAESNKALPLELVQEQNLEEQNLQEENFDEQTLQEESFVSQVADEHAEDFATDLDLEQENIGRSGATPETEGLNNLQNLQQVLDLPELSEQDKGGSNPEELIEQVLVEKSKDESEVVNTPEEYDPNTAEFDQTKIPIKILMKLIKDLNVYSTIPRLIDDALRKNNIETRRNANAKDLRTDEEDVPLEPDTYPTYSANAVPFPYLNNKLPVPNYDLCGSCPNYQSATSLQQLQQINFLTELVNSMMSKFVYRPLYSSYVKK